MSQSKDTHKNVTSHPLDLDDGSSVGSEEFTKITKVGPVAQSYIDAGHLVAVPEGKARAGAEPSGTAASSKAKEASS